jgi:hypothetical protein
LTVAYVGSLSIGDAVPGAATVAAAGVAGISAALPDITARLEALAAFAPLPVDFTAQLVLAQQMLASVQLGISLGIPVPSIAAQIAAIVALVAELSAALAAINAQLEIIVDFQALLGAAGIHAYAYAGDTDQLGPELTAELAAGVPGGAASDPANALVLVTTLSATWTAMGSVFKVTP